jgi:hypothetical protein
MCQSGVCTEGYAGAFTCSKPCGSADDCSPTERCAIGLYEGAVLFGMRHCSPGQPDGGGVGDSCYPTGNAACASLFCDSTYWNSELDFALEPFCTGVCDQDDDCPLLYPGYYDLRMRCIYRTNSVIQPVIGGWCAPHWCARSTDCPMGSSCYLDANPDRWGGYPSGICRG